MIDTTSNKQVVSDFSGAWNLLDSKKVQFPGGLISRNVEFNEGEVSTRHGFLAAFSPVEAATTLFNWITRLNLLVWYRTADRFLRAMDISTGTLMNLVASDLVGYSAILANLGSRLAIAPFTTAQRGAASGRIVSYQSAAYVSDQAFLGPITYTPGAPTEPAGAGFVTAGAHRLGFRIEYRNGFTTRPSPSTSGVPGVTTFAPVTATATGAKKWEWVLNPTTWPVGAVRVWPIMATVSNPNRFYMVPGASQTVTGGSADSKTITINISDDDLIATAVDCTESLRFLTIDTAGAVPFNPYHVMTHGDRVSWLTTINDNVGVAQSVAYISNKNASQEITAEFHGIQLPGAIDIVTQLSLDGVLYFFGPHWTYRTTDNGAEPTTWPTPHLVDGRRGTLSLRGTEMSPSGRFAWVAAQDGLYLFEGAYPELPVSYLQTPTWNRINWNYAHTIQIKDNPTTKKVVVLAPLDSATTPSHILGWDYKKGFEYFKTGFSLDDLSGYAMGAMEVVENTLTGSAVGVAKKQELWIAPSTTADPFVRQATDMDATPYRDDGAGIASQYRTALFRKAPGKLKTRHGAHIRVTGTGLISIAAFSMDDVLSWGPDQVNLQELPGDDYLMFMNLLAEGLAYDFSMSGSADAHFTLAEITDYTVPFSLQT